MNSDAPILVAEDDQTDLLILRMAVERARLPNPLIVVRDGQELVDYLTHLPDPHAGNFPGLILLDLKMPRLNGFDVLTWLATQPGLRHVPVVVLSSSPHEGDMEKARRLGARDYFVKPHSLGQLVDFLHRLSAHWLSVATLKVAAGTVGARHHHHRRHTF